MPEITDETIAELLAQDTPGQQGDVFPDVPAETFDAPKGAENFDLPEFAEFEAPKTKRKGSLGPDDQMELAEFFTEDGIGAIVARGFDAFFSACDAEKMSQAESKNMAKVTAYYCRARFPKSAGAYQPEILLAATIFAAVLPRIQPIAEKTAPFWARLRDRIANRFQKKEG
jgi:hypothetical protein